MWSIGVKNLLAIPGLLSNNFPVCCSIGMVEREEGGCSGVQAGFPKLALPGGSGILYHSTGILSAQAAQQHLVWSGFARCLFRDVCV